jgi:hypothetical protein
MTRPELPPGWAIYPTRHATKAPGSFCRKSDLLTLTREGCTHQTGNSHAGLVELAWRVWNSEKPEWAAYLAHLENTPGIDPRDRLLADHTTPDGVRHITMQFGAPVLQETLTLTSELAR